jgi:hypothetical protein
MEGRKVMAWFTANWFWIVIGAVFIGMHLFGHGGHGGHGGRDRQKPSAENKTTDEGRSRAVNPTSSGHQH